VRPLSEVSVEGTDWGLVRLVVFMISMPFK
jgi:hypothetical protein